MKAQVVFALVLLAGTAHAERCPAPSPDPGAEMLRPYDTPEFRAQLRRGHAWRDSAGFVGEYFSRLELAAFLGEHELVKELLPFAPTDVLLEAAALTIYSGHRDVLILLLDTRHLSHDARFVNDVPLMALASGPGTLTCCASSSIARRTCMRGTVPSSSPRS